MYTRRAMLGAITLPAAAAATGLFAAAPRPGASWREILRSLARHPGSPEAVSGDEDFWFEVSRAFTVDRSLVNLNNGGVSPSPRWVQEAQKRHLDYSNTAPPYTMWQILEPQREGVRERLARQWDVDPEEIALTRNASEGLQICQFGFDLQPGDEVLTTTLDYPRMITTFRQRARREGIVLRQFDLPVPAEDPAEIVSRFEQHITERTKLILVSHVVFLNGQILPVAEVAAMGRRRGIPVIIDGAHALAHFDFTLGELDCDYYATSLHKWLFAPHGTGLLYVRREKIADLWPLMAADEKQSDDIRKFEEIGTHPAAGYLAIAEALNIHQGIGPARKEARLVHLRDAWATRLLESDRVRLHTSLKPGFAAGIATVQIDGIKPGDLTNWLWDEHRILVVGITHDQFEGIRVSPSVYTTMEELDRFASAMEHVIRHGLPA
jgi:selenocysteine lyase/cysteine desulfurase